MSFKTVVRFIQYLSLLLVLRFYLVIETYRGFCANEYYVLTFSTIAANFGNDVLLSVSSFNGQSGRLYNIRAVN